MLFARWPSAYVSRILFALLVCRLGSGFAFAETLKIGGTGAALGTMRLLGEEFSRKNPAIRVEVLPYIGSTGAIKAVDSGAIDLGLSARPPKPAEEKLNARLTPYALTPLVVVTHSATVVDGLTGDQLAAIYEGKQVRWDNGRPIRLVLRPARETDNDALRLISPEMSDAVDTALARPGMRYAATDQDAADMLEQTPGALGTSTLALLLSEKRKLNVLAINGVKPSVDTLARGRYPYLKPLYLVVRAAPSPAVQSFVAFVRSPRGQEILTTYGQHPVKP
jgi:phosphate transport system substrate-binding protein